MAHTDRSPLLGVAALQLRTRRVSTADNLAHIDALLSAECARLGVKRWHCGGGDDASSTHMDLLVLPELFNAPYLLTEEAWCYAESLSDPARSPSLRQLSAWAVRFRCYVAATLLEATPEGHFYNSLVLAAPDGGFVRRQLSRDGAGARDGDDSPGSLGAQGCSAGGGGSSGSVALVRKHRASSLEAFVFRSAGAGGRGGEPAAHVVELDAAPLLRKRGLGGTSGGAADGQSSASSDGELARTLRIGVAICYENMCLPPMQAILEEHRRKPLDLLVSPFCAMAPRHDHPTFGWPQQAAERFAAMAAGVARLHAAKLHVHAVACHHAGPWSSPLPRLLPFLPRERVPLSGPMLGATAVYAPDGASLARVPSEKEGLALVQLPLLQRPRGEPPPVPPLLAGSALAAAAGAAAAASADAGPLAPFARYAGGYVVAPSCWQVAIGFSLMEALGWLHYHLWSAGRRRSMAAAVAAEGSWRGPVPPPLGGDGWRRGAVACAAAVGAAVLALSWAARKA